MSDGPRILLTNDDGIDHPGIGAMAAALSAVGTVTTVAPDEDQSGVGRRGSREVTVRDHGAGHAVEGTPCDCVRYGLRGLDPAFDLVVSGCNDGPNLGAFKLGRSGTVAAAVEAAYLGTPAIAVSAYDPEVGKLADPTPDQYAFPREVVGRLVPAALSAGVFERADLLNVHVPTRPTGAVRITRPMTEYDVEVEQEGTEVQFSKPFYGPLDAEDPVAHLEERGERETDRRACAEAAVGVAPLTLDRERPAVPELKSALADLAADATE